MVCALRAVKLAVTLCGPLMLTVVLAAVEEATDPVQPAKTYPAFGVAVIVAEEPALR
jgi:hypothetical protein